MKEKKKLNKKRFSRIVSVVVYVLTALSCCMVGVFARYTSSAPKSVEGGVALWEVSVEFTGKKTKFDLIDKDGQKTAEYTFDVISESEVALSYDVVLTMPEVLPEGFVIFTIVDVNGQEVTPSVSESGRTYTFSDVGTFTSDGGRKSHTLQITSTFEYNSIKLEGIKVEVVAEQTN